MIDNCVVGGPAYNTRRLEHGDVIKFIDRISATQDNIHELLIGKDIPGTSVTVIVAKGNDNVKLLLSFCSMILQLTSSYRDPFLR